MHTATIWHQELDWEKKGFGCEMKEAWNLTRIQQFKQNECKWHHLKWTQKTIPPKFSPINEKNNQLWFQAHPFHSGIFTYTWCAIPKPHSKQWNPWNAKTARKTQKPFTCGGSRRRFEDRRWLWPIGPSGCSWLYNRSSFLKRQLKYPIIPI